MKLYLENWFCIEKLEIPLDRRLSLLVAGHEEGKSAIRDAFTFVTTGTLTTRPEVRQKKEIGITAIRQGAKKATVRLEDGELAIERSVDLGGKQDLKAKLPKAGLASGVASGQAAIYEELALDEDRALAALDSWRFLTLPESDARALLFRAIGQEVTAEQVKKKLVEGGVDDTTAGTLAEIAGRDFRAAEKHAVEKRRDAKRDLEAQPAMPPAPLREIDGKEMDLSKIPLDQAVARLESLRAQRDEALRGGGELIGTAKALLAVERPQAEDIERQLIDYRDSAPQRARIRECDESLERAENVRAGAQQEINAAKAIIATSTRLQQPEECPVMGTRCIATEAALKKLGKELAGAADEARDVVEKGAAELAEIEAARAEVERERAEIVAIVGEPKSFDVAEAEAKLADLQRSITHNEGIFEQHGDEAPDLAEISHRIAIGETLVEAKRIYDDAVADYEARDTSDLSEKVEAWDNAAQLLKPEGVETALVADLLPDFIDTVNEITEATGLGTFSIDTELQITVGCEEGGYFFPAQLSRSARLRLGIAIQHAFACFAHFPVLVVDELDVFNAKLSPLVMAALFDVARQYRAVLGLATLKVGAPKKPPTDDVQMLWLRSSTIEEVTS